MAFVLRVLALLLLAVGLAPLSNATPAFPGAKRRVDATGRWYVTVEALSDRCALVACARDSKALSVLRDVGQGRHGVPGINPIRRGDRVVARARIGGYPIDFLPASDGSGFAAITQDYGPPGYPRGELVTLLNWVPVDGPQVSIVLPQPPRPAVMPVGYTTPWQVRRIEVKAGLLVVVSNGHAQPLTVVRVADGAIQVVSREAVDAKLAAKSVFKTPLRKRWMPKSTRAEERKARVLAAIRGEASPQITGLERASIVTRAYEFLGDSASAALLELLSGEPVNVTHPERNVRRAALWALRSRPEGVAHAASVAFDGKAPVRVRVAAIGVIAPVQDKPGRQRLLTLVADSSPHVSTAAVAALSDHQWDAGPQFIKLLEDANGNELAIAAYFEAYVVAGSVSGLLRALKRSKSGSRLRSTLAKALQTQTRLNGIGEDPVAWEDALQSLR